MFHTLSKTFSQSHFQVRLVIYIDDRNPDPHFGPGVGGNDEHTRRQYAAYLEPRFR